MPGSTMGFKDRVTIHQIHPFHARAAWLPLLLRSIECWLQKFAAGHTPAGDASDDRPGRAIGQAYRA